MEQTENGSHRIVHLRFKPLWLYVDAVREFCGFFARATFEDRQVGQRVGIIVHELVENAIRYGDDQELELQVERGENSMAIAVSNTASDEDAERLQSVFKSLHAEDPQAAYATAIRAAAQKPSGMSGLGLPRVRHEGQVDLSLDRMPGRVMVTARGAL